MLTIDPALRESLSATPILTRDHVSALTSAPAADVRRWTTGANPAVQRGVRTGWTPYTVSFAGLLEADLLHMLTQMPHMTARSASSVMRRLRAEHGPMVLIEHPTLVTDGKDVFLADDDDYVRVRDSQRAFAKVLERYTRRLIVEGDRVQAYRPERLSVASVDPLFNGGGLSLTTSRVPVSSIAGMLLAGEPAEAVAKDYQVPVEEVRAVERDLDWAWRASAA